MSEQQPVFVTGIRPLPYPLESYVCRSFLSQGTCPFDSALLPSEERSRLQMVPLSRMEPPLTHSDSPSSTSSSSSTRSVPEQDRPAHHIRRTKLSRERCCRYLHVDSAHVKELLCTLVTMGFGYVVCCRNFQSRRGGCERAPAGGLCKFLHLTTEEEAKLLSVMSPQACKARADFLSANGYPVRAVSTDAACLPPSNATTIVVGGPVRPLCRQFLRHECHRGAECRFLHPPMHTTGCAHVALPLDVSQPMFTPPIIVRVGSINPQPFSSLTDCSSPSHQFAALATPCLLDASHNVPSAQERENRGSPSRQLPPPPIAEVPITILRIQQILQQLNVDDDC